MPNYIYINEQVATVEGFLTSDECDAFISLAESKGFADAPIDTALGPQMRKDVRNNKRVIVDDPALASQLWEKIPNYIPHRIGDWTACGVNERFRFYRYDLGEQFDWHYDGSFVRNDQERSHITFMIYLNDGFSGGETSIEDLHISPGKGKALFFVHRVRHKGQPIITGRKYVLRTDVMYRLRRDD